MASLSVAWLFAVFGSLTPAGTLTLAVFEIAVQELPLIKPVALQVTELLGGRFRD